MNTLIIEDEELSARALQKTLYNQSILPFKHIEVANSVSHSLEILAEYRPQLLFLDIHLGDGTGFEILETLPLTTGVVFITAYDSYALKAHQYHCWGYITKPFEEKEIHKLLAKIKSVSQVQSEHIIQRRFLVKSGSNFTPLKDEDIAFFYVEGKHLFVTDLQGNTFLYEKNLSQISHTLDRQLFFRINRNVCVNIKAIKKVYKLGSLHYKIETIPALPSDMYKNISKNNIKDFKDWICS